MTPLNSTAKNKPSYEPVLKYWFGDLDRKNESAYKHKSWLWFNPNAKTDEDIRNQFLAYVDAASDGGLEDWKSQKPDGHLALIIVLDQFTRNVYRGSEEMFKNHPKAVELANEIMADQFEFNQLANIEQYFVFKTLLYSENIKMAMKGLDLIGDLVMRTSKDPNSLNFIKMYHSAKTLFGMLSKFGRYPFMNALLGRESTYDELKFLKSNPMFLKSVNLAKPAKQSNNKPSNIERQKSTNHSKSQDLPFQKILFLHGFRQSSHKMKKRLSKLSYLLKTKCNAHITFLNGTHPYSPKGNRVSEVAETFGEDSLNPIESQRVWYNANDDFTAYHGISESIEHVLTHVKQEGPYDGIIGFSQGSCLAAILLKKQPQLFRFYISISGFVPRAKDFEHFYSKELKSKVPSMHIYGKSDLLVEASRSQAFAQCFEESIEYQHKGGHFVPDMWPNEEIAEFVLKQIILISKSFVFEENQPFAKKISDINECVLRLRKVDELNLEPLFQSKKAAELFKSNSDFSLYKKSPSLDAYLKIKPALDGLSIEDRLVLFYLILVVHKYDKQERALHGENLNEDANDNDEIISILLMWMDCYISGLSNANDLELLNESVDICFVNTQNWRELSRVCDLSYQLANNEDSIFQKLMKANDDDKSNEVTKKQLNSLYFKLIDAFTAQLLVDLRTLDFKKNSYLVHQLTQLDSNETNKYKFSKGSLFSDLNSSKPVANIELHGGAEVEEYDLDSLKFISDLALNMPRTKSSLDKRSRIARECAIRINPFDNANIILKRLDSQNQDPHNDPLLKKKILSYNHYRKILTALSSYNHDLKRLNNVETNPRVKLHLARRDLNVMKNLMNAPISESILNPIPEPVDASTYEQMSPLYEWLVKQDKVLDCDLKFLKGTVTTDGRMDLCKQVIGPKGIDPLLQSLGSNKHITRILLGNNIIGDKGGSTIAEYIKSGQSPITVWYIAGNQFTATGIEPICEALKNDTQVTGLWLKRNPLKAPAMVHISSLLSFNNTLNVLDLLNCGLLDEGVKILFESGLSKNTTLEHLYLSANGITPEGLKSVRDYYASGKSCLKTLFLGCNRIGSEGAKILADGFSMDKTNKLERLNIASSRIDGIGMGYLAEALLNQKSLQVLDVGYMRATLDLGELGNFIQDDGAQHLCKLIKSSSLKSLNITHNHITQTGINRLIEAVEHNRSLIELNYVQYGVSYDEITLDKLFGYLDRNRKALLDSLSHDQLMTIFIDEKSLEEYRSGRLTKLRGVNFEGFLIPDHVRQVYSVYRTH